VLLKKSKTIVFDGAFMDSVIFNSQAYIDLPRTGLGKW